MLDKTGFVLWLFYNGGISYFSSMVDFLGEIQIFIEAISLFMDPTLFYI